ncbi:MAG: hypothetical protein ACLT8T_13640, partial [Oscillospiraceae bacterium]
RTHLRLRRFGSDYIGLVRPTGLEPARSRNGTSGCCKSSTELLRSPIEKAAPSNAWDEVTNHVLVRKTNFHFVHDLWT